MPLLLYNVCVELIFYAGLRTHIPAWNWFHIYFFKFNDWFHVVSFT